jgi:hypothetical protein
MLGRRIFVAILGFILLNLAFLISPIITGHDADLMYGPILLSSSLRLPAPHPLPPEAKARATFLAEHCWSINNGFVSPFQIYLFYCR